MTSARADLLRALGALCEAPDPGHAGVAEALGLPAPGNDGTFLFQVYPYASVFLGAEGMLGGKARDRVAGFWRAVGLTPPPEPDHLASLLGLAAALFEDETAETDPARRALRRQARTALLWEHIWSWAMPFLRATAAAGGPFHGAWAALTEETLLDEGRALGGPPAELPVALNDAPAFPDDDARLDDILTAALAPVRSGIVVTRDDLARAGRALGLGVRIGERRFILRSMVEQDPAGTFRWLADEAAAWAGTHAATGDVLGGIAMFWEERARAANARFLQLTEAAEEVMVGAADR
jgi:hypothetical protein